MAVVLTEDNTKLYQDGVYFSVTIDMRHDGPHPRILTIEGPELIRGHVHFTKVYADGEVLTGGVISPIMGIRARGVYSCYEAARAAVQAAATTQWEFCPRLELAERTTSL
jgi:hypothetical protein